MDKAGQDYSRITDIKSPWLVHTHRKGGKRFCCFDKLKREKRHTYEVPSGTRDWISR